MQNPALILVHPGSLAAHGGSCALDDAVREIENHDGPIVVIDGFLSDKTAPYDDRLRAAFSRAEQIGHFALRLWGCDGGEHPFAQWPGYKTPGISIQMVHNCQEKAAAQLSEILSGRNAVLSGAWATYDQTSGCVTSVGQALKRAGWAGTYTMSENVLYEEDHDI